MIESTAVQRASTGASVGETAGILMRLRLACSVLTATGEESVRGTTLSVSCCTFDEGLLEGIRRYAEEQCLTAEVQQSVGRLVICLRRAERDTGR